MLIGSAQFEFLIPGVSSLKEKRFVLKSIKTRLQNKFNASVAEVDHHDKWQRACLGIACVSNERRFLDETLNKIMNILLEDTRIELIDQAIEIF